MGIFKKKEKNDIKIAENRSATNREEERVKALEATLDFLRDNKNHSLETEKNEDKLVNVSENAAEDNNNLLNSESANINQAENTNSDNLNQDNIVMQKNVSNNDLNSMAIAKQNAIKNKYGRRMDYKTAKVSTGSEDANKKVDPSAKNTAMPTNKNVEKVNETNIQKQNSTEDTKQSNEIKEDKAITELENVNSAEAMNAPVKDLHSDSQSVINDSVTQDKQDDAKINTDNQNIVVQNVSDTTSKESDRIKENIEIKDESSADAMEIEHQDEKTITDNTTLEQQKVNASEKVEAIPNPLPTPKKHIPREMEFDLIPEEKDMHFDIVDLTGKDFFDIN